MDSSISTLLVGLFGGFLVFTLLTLGAIMWFFHRSFEKLIFAPPPCGSEGSPQAPPREEPAEPAPQAPGSVEVLELGEDEPQPIGWKADCGESFVVLSSVRDDPLRGVPAENRIVKDGPF